MSGAPMKVLELLLIGLGAYLALVVAFECFVVIMGTRQAARGVAPDEEWVVITTQDADGRTDTVVGGVESAGHLYVAANHWPRGWYQRALRNPHVELTRAGERRACRAVPVTGAERARIARDYRLPWIARLLTGFPPRSFLRLDPR